MVPAMALDIFVVNESEIIKWKNLYTLKSIMDLFYKLLVYHGNIFLTYRKTPFLVPWKSQFSNANNFSFEQIMIYFKTGFKKAQDEDLNLFWHLLLVDLKKSY